MSPPAPERFSTTTCCPRSSDSVGAMMRAVVSVPPPGSKPTTVVTGLAGKVCACALNGAMRGVMSATASADAATTIFMDILLVGNDAGALDDRLPFLNFVFDERESVLGRVLHDRGAARL